MVSRSFLNVSNYFEFLTRKKMVPVKYTMRFLLNECNGVMVTVIVLHSHTSMIESYCGKSLFLNVQNHFGYFTRKRKLQVKYCHYLLDRRDVLVVKQPSCCKNIFLALLW